MGYLLLLVQLFIFLKVAQYISYMKNKRKTTELAKQITPTSVGSKKSFIMSIEMY